MLLLPCIAPVFHNGAVINRLVHVKILPSMMVSIAAAGIAGCSTDSGDSAPKAAATTAIQTAATTTSASQPGARIGDIMDNPVAAGAFLNELKIRQTMIIRRNANMAVSIGGEMCNDLDKGMTYPQLSQKWTADAFTAPVRCRTPRPLSCICARTTVRRSRSRLTPRIVCGVPLTHQRIR